MTIIKKLFTTALALLFSTTVNAYFVVDGIAYNIISWSDRTVSVVYTSGYHSYSGEVIIPPTINYNSTQYTVTRIGDKAFDCATELTRVIIPNSVTTIEASAFRGCKSLVSIEIGDRVTEIGNEAFSGCYALTHITIPNSVKTLGENAFSGNNLTQITIGNGLETIGDYAFNLSQKLESIRIPQSVKKIGNSAFWRCDSLKHVYIEDSCSPLFLGAGSISYNYDDGLGFFKPTGLETIYIGRDLEYEANDSKKGYSPFYKVETLKSVTIGGNVTSLAKNLFKECSNLTEVIIANGITSIEESAFYNCNSLSKIVLPNSTRTIGCRAFASCDNLAEVIMPKMLTNIENYSFSACGSLRKIVLPDSLTNLGERAFYGCKILTEVNIPQNLTIIKDGTFESCQNIEEIIIPNNITTIGHSAFRNCENLRNIVLPKNITSFSDLIFSESNNIETIYCLSRKAVTGSENIFSQDAYNNAILYVPEDREPAYSKTEPWSNFYIKPIKSFNVTYLLDGIEYARYTVESYSEIPIPGIPTKEGYTFTGWSDIPPYMPTKDITISGSLTVKSYAVKYIVDGEIIATDSIKYGNTIPLIEGPTKEGYTFSGWRNVPETMPAQDIEITGTFSINSYTITYIVDGKIYATDSIIFNSDVVLIEIPQKEGHTFSGWSYAPKKMPAEDITISGSFTVNYYTLTYMIDGKTISSESIAYGTSITPMDNPQKEGYTFSGWSNVPTTMPAQDVEVTGTYKINTYALVYIIDGEIFATDSLTYGSKIILRDEPSQEGCTFSGWSDVPETMPANDVEVYGSFALTHISDNTKEISVKIQKNNLILSGAYNYMISILTPNGVLVKKIDAYAGEIITLDKGIYLVYINNKAIKVKL